MRWLRPIHHHNSEPRPLSALSIVKDHSPDFEISSTSLPSVTFLRHRRVGTRFGISFPTPSSSFFPSSTPAYSANASSGYSHSLDSYLSFHLPFVRFSHRPRAPTIPRAKEKHPPPSKNEANTGRSPKTPALYVQRTHHCNSVIPRADFRCNLSRLVIPACQPTPFILRM